MNIHNFNVGDKVVGKQLFPNCKMILHFGIITNFNYDKSALFIEIVHTITSPIEFKDINTTYFQQTIPQWNTKTNIIVHIPYNSSKNTHQYIIWEKYNENKYYTNTYNNL